MSNEAMKRGLRRFRPAGFLAVAATVFALAGTTARPAAAGEAATCAWTDPPRQLTFPEICYRAFPGVPSSTGADSTVSRKVTLRWVRDRQAEARPDFGGYRIYRTATVRDTSRMELVRRFAYNDTLLWHFPDDQDTLQFVDPDSAGNVVKVCREVDNLGRCISVGDSVFKLIPPPGPHNGYALYYSITYGAIDQTRREVTDMFVPDTGDNYDRCNVRGDPTSCPNLNGKITNLLREPVFVTGAATTNVEDVVVVPNPYRGSERWDQPGQRRVQFQRLPAEATVRVFTISGDLVRKLVKTDPQSDSIDWDLKNGEGQDVTSGIYLFHVFAGVETSEGGGYSPGYEQKGHFVVIL